MAMKDNLLKIIAHYGLLKQLKYSQSEIFELNEAIIRFEQFKYDVATTNEYGYDEYMEKVNENISHIAEEIADCYVMLEQFRQYYEIPNKNLEKIMRYKIERQLERMKKNER